MTERRSIVLALEPPPPELPRHVAYHAIRWVPVLVLAVLTYIL